MPIGGYKGYGLALIVGLLAGTLNGAAMGRDVIDFNNDYVSITNTGQSWSRSTWPRSATRRVQARDRSAWDTMKFSPLLPGFDEIRLPGERTHRVEQDRRARGVPLHPALCRALSDLAAELDIAPL